MIQHVKLYEEYSHTDSQFFQTKEETENWLDKMKIKNYTINDDLTVDVDGDIYLISKKLKYIPVKFRKVGGDFYCFENRLTSLEGCPTSVGGDFYCNKNQLNSLENCPNTVGGYFYCQNNQLTSLEGCPQYVGGSFVCYENKLTSLVFAPKEPSSYGSNPCAKFYNFSGFNTQSHIKALLECDPNPADTIQRLKKYNPSLAKELSLEFGLEDEELQNTYNKVKNIEGGYF